MTSWSASFPRIRGDVPSWCVRTRSGLPVFPAYAGMFRRPLWRRKYCRSFPRIRGDVPPSALASLNASSFSPHTRGCSGAGRLPSRRTIVFPAYAGMFRFCTASITSSSGFPRIRGDVPMSSGRSLVGITFSPHTRGCSAAGIETIPAVVVFPAYAGMFRFPVPPRTRL